MAETKAFPTADVLSAAGGVLVSKRGIYAVYEVLNWMTGESVFTHQIPRIRREARPVVAALSPQISAALDDMGEITRKNWAHWLRKWEKVIGEEIAVPRMTPNQHESIDPLSELVERVSPDRIHVVKV